MTPIMLARPEALLPVAYRLILRSQHCSNCGTTHEWSELYAVQTLRSRLDTKAGITNLVPVDHFMYNLPIQLRRMETRRVVICQECSDHISLSHLPTVPQPTAACTATAHDKPAAKPSSRRTLTAHDL